MVNASSWAAVAPASRMWYPLIETGCQSGISSVQKAIRSPIRRIAGRSGTTHSFWAMNSLRMSACSVPRSPWRATPARSAATTNSASATGAGPEIVIDVETAPRSMPSNSRDMSAADATDTPSPPTSPSDSGWSGS